jgi:hypothetical protein
LRSWTPGIASASTSEAKPYLLGHRYRTVLAEVALLDGLLDEPLDVLRQATEIAPPACSLHVGHPVL